ncbi:polysaccharide deacetylase family protein [Halolamina sp. CBA1230]|uniref:polysaccharide deacetylase family protein n=1 Tax=Halolamina sp. CBA1230 TaxID=1853690 RepID=UPI0009A17E94|nr:polysaccharide deacetylase family protein [Halolamina sp. CBA1230]QKY19102.1 polysaccharide deacetylase family protein [Halolamina sp. CBA1230]
MGDVVVSIDAELAWGYHDLPTAPDRIDHAREGWHATLSLLAKHDVPATWGIVGHLLLDECDGSHEDHPLGPSWFSCSAGRATVDDDWHAPKLVEAVRSSEQDHELASHSFSHVVMDVDGVTRAVADAEIEKSIATAERRGLDFESFIFPRNGIAHRDVLADRAVRCYRGWPPDRWYDESLARPLVKLADWSRLGTAPPIVTPTVDEHGLVNVPASLYLFSFEGPARRVARLLGRSPIVSAAKRGIDEAVGADGVFHLWFHPHNLLQPDGVERLDAVLEHVARRREETDLTVRTMGEVAAGVLGERGAERSAHPPTD